MTNEEILKSRWSSIDKQLEKYLKVYKKINQKTKDKLQTIFDSLNITYSDINNYVPSSLKKRLDRYIVELKGKGLLRDYFGYTARLLFSRKNISYRELIEFVIMAAYIEEYSELESYNQVFFYNMCEYSYKQGIKDISKAKKVKHNSFDLPLFYTLMNIPLLGITAKAYLYSVALTNANETYKQCLVNMQLNRALNVNDGLFRNLLAKQMKRLISINEGKYSGGIVNVSENLVNNAYLQAGVDNDVEQCRFIAEMDDRTTKMCESLDNQLFYLNKMNIYQRYSEVDKKYITYHTKGLVLGENLPPITNHFHWCRSTITYLIDITIKKYKDITNKWLKQKKVGEHHDVKMLDKVFCYKGIKYEIDGHFVKYEFCKGEKEFAEWLSKNSDKKITLLPKINKPEKIQTPDYIIDYEYFDYKYTTGASSQLIYHNLYDKKEQSSNFIIEINNDKVTIADIYEQIDYTYRRLNWVKKIAIKQQDIFIVFERQ